MFLNQPTHRVYVLHYFVNRKSFSRFKVRINKSNQPNHHHLRLQADNNLRCKLMMRVALSGRNKVIIQTCNDKRFDVVGSLT